MSHDPADVPLTPSEQHALSRATPLSSLDAVFGVMLAPYADMPVEQLQELARDPDGPSAALGELLRRGEPVHYLNEPRPWL